jgi:acyl carrier protein
MSDPLVFDRLAATIRKFFYGHNFSITRDTTADQVPGWDSLNHARLLMQVEDDFSIRFDPEEVIELENVGELADIIEQKGASRN